MGTIKNCINKFIIISCIVVSFFVSPQTVDGVQETFSAPKTFTAKASGTIQLQGMGPTIMANTNDGEYAYVGFHLSDTIAKIRLADLTVETMVDLSQNFPIQCYRMVLDVSEKKLFVYCSSWRKLIVLDTQTLSVIHTIEDIEHSGMIRSQFGTFLITWNGGNSVNLVNTETYEVTQQEMGNNLFILSIQEYGEDQTKWYVVTQALPYGQGPFTIGLYDHVAKTWVNSITIPLQSAGDGIWDFKVLPDESKLYAAIWGGTYPEENHDYGWVYSIDLLSWQINMIPTDGAPISLETSPDSQRVYVAVDHPMPENMNNILVIDAQTDTILGPVHLGYNKYNWPYTEIRDLQIDLANPDFLFAVSNDANAFIKVDLKNLSLASATIFNEQDLSPHFFARRPVQPSGYVLVHQKDYGFDLDIGSAAVRNLVKFPEIRTDSGAYGVVITNAGRLLIAQGEQVLEVEGTDMSLIAIHPLPSTIPSVWGFILSKDQSKLYSITADPDTNSPNVFLAINTADFQVQANYSLSGGVFNSPFELPDGSKLYALGGQPNGTIVIHVIETNTYSIQKTISFEDPDTLGFLGISAGPYYPYAYDSSSHTLYLGGGGVVLAIDTVTDEIKQVIQLAGVATAIGLEPQQSIYVNAIGLIYQPQENFLYIAHLDRSFVSIYDLNSNQFIPQVIPLKGFFPNYVFANDDISKIYVVNTRSDSITVIDVESKSVEKVIDLHAYLQEFVVTSPNGGESWAVGSGQNITWTSAGSIANIDIDYSTNSGGDWTSVVTNTLNDGSYAWTVPSAPSTTCLVRISDAADKDHSDSSDSVFTITTSSTETISTPNTPSGPDSGTITTSYDYSTGGSTSNLGHDVQYFFDWDDGSDSGWLATGTTTASHSWVAAGTYDVRAMARCVDHTTVESLWSTTFAVTISDGGVTGHFNSPSQRLILPEVNWASASGGGDWISEVQITDVTGGSVVQVYYNSGINRRGPFTLWNNSSGAAGSSTSWGNVLQTIDALDADPFTYYGTGGSLEMITQDSSHTIQAAIRSYNGNYSRTFPALADVETNTAALGRTMMVPNMSMDANFRPSLVLFNPGSDSVTADVQIVGSNGSQVGPTITRTVAGYEMAGVAGLRDQTYSNADFRVTVTGGSGRLIVSGQSANNTSNDPAAHVAVQTGPGYATSPAERLIFPEVNWASASGGGDWAAELHITDMSGGAVVQVYYNSGTSRRGPFTLWTNSGGANASVTFSNILQTIDGLDAGAFTYYGTGGALELVTQDNSHLIQAALKGYNGNVTRTFPAFQDCEANTAAVGRDLLIPNLSMNTAYRPSVALFNTTADSVNVEVRIINSNGSQIGSTITLTLAGYEMAGVAGLRDTSYSNACIRVTVTSGSGRVLASGQSANNTSNDPAAHIAVQGQ